MVHDQLFDLSRVTLLTAYGLAPCPSSFDPVRVTADLLVTQGSVGSSGQEVCTRSMRPVRMLLVEKVADSMVTRLPFSMRGGTLTKRAPRRT